MLKFFYIASIIILIFGGIVFFNFEEINEKLASFSERDKRLPVSGESEIDPEIFNSQQYMKSQNKIVHLVAVGDIMLSRNVGQKMVKYSDYQYPYREIYDLLQKADITFGNLETPLIAGPPVHSPSMVFRADPECVSALAWAGFDVLSLANNHIMNKGQTGLDKTLKLLSEEGILGVGAGMNSEEAHRAQVIERKGVKIAFLAYAYPGNPEASQDRGGAAIMEKDQLKKDLSYAREKADFTIVSMHAGTEYKRYPNQGQIDFARAAIDLGADLVIGHHPHWFQTVERYKDKYIIYSLGNFVFDQMWSEETREGMIASIYLDKAGVQGLEFFPIKIYDYSQPRFVGGAEEERLLSLLDLEFQDLPLFFEGDSALEALKEGTRKAIYGEKVMPYVPETRKIDFDHNGKEETLVLQNNQLSIFKDQKEIFKTEANWVVNDYALADFDADGFTDLALALWKKGDYAEGAPFETVENREHWGSHLFLYSFREGKPKIIWGSSLLPRPIVELAAGDIDEDQNTELVVLEGDYKDPYKLISNNISVMHWDDWGFTQEWKKPGNYYNLRVYNLGNLGYYIYVNATD